MCGVVADASRPPLAKKVTMIKNAFLFAFCICCNFAYSQTTDFTISPINEDFALLGVVEGSAISRGSFLIVHVNTLSIRAHERHDRINSNVKFRLGVARMDRDGQWEVRRWSEAIKTNMTFKSGDTKSYKNIELVIPIDGINLKEGYWLVLQTESTTEGRVGYCYSHSDREVFR